METIITPDATSTALIAKDISYISKDIAEIKQSVKDLAGVYATKVSVDDANRVFETRLKKVEESGNLWRWLSPSIAAVMGSVLTFLIVQYLSK